MKAAISTGTLERGQVLCLLSSVDGVAVTQLRGNPSVDTQPLDNNV